MTDTPSGYFRYRIKRLESSKDILNFIEDYYDRIYPADWHNITKHPKFTMTIAMKYPDKVDWEFICTFRKLSESEIEAAANYVNWYEISAFQRLSLSFIKKYKDKLSLDAILRNEKFGNTERLEFLEIFEKNNDPKHHKIWDENLQKSKMFCPKVFRSNYNDYPGARMDEEPKKNFGIIHGKIGSDNKKNDKKDEPKKSKSKKQVINEKPKEDKTNTKKKPEVKKDVKKSSVKSKKKIDYNTMTKAQLKEILTKRKIRFLYHDTIDILREKCRESE